MDSSSQVPLIIFLAFISGVVGSFIGAAKGKAGAGFMVGTLLGPIGWLVVGTLAPTPEVLAKRNQQVAALTEQADSATLRPCPWCAEQIQRAAVVCRHCGRDVVR